MAQKWWRSPALHPAVYLIKCFLVNGAWILVAKSKCHQGPCPVWNVCKIRDFIKSLGVLKPQHGWSNQSFARGRWKLKWYQQVFRSTKIAELISQWVNKRLLHACCMPDTLLGTRDTKKGKNMVLARTIVAVSLLRVSFLVSQNLSPRDQCLWDVFLLAPPRNWIPN